MNPIIRQGTNDRHQEKHTQGNLDGEQIGAAPELDQQMQRKQPGKYRDDDDRCAESERHLTVELSGAHADV